jgi:hypothetical protein
LEENLGFLSPRQQKRAKIACQLYKTMGTPTVDDLRGMIRMNLIKNNVVTTDDVNLAMKAYGLTVPPRTHPPRVLWNPREIQAPGMGLDVMAHHQYPLTHCSTQAPPTQGALESKRDPGTWNGTRCDGPPPVDDPLTHCSTQDPPTQVRPYRWRLSSLQE